MNVPTGRLVASTGWKNTNLISLINSDVCVNFCDDLGGLDFIASDDVAVVYLNEAELVSDVLNCKRRVIRFCRSDSSNKIVIVQRTSLTSDTYKSFQRFCGIEIGLPIIPVSSDEEAAKLLKQIVVSEIKKQANPFIVKRTDINSPDEAILNTLHSIPGLGDKKAFLLLEQFGSLENIINAPKEELAKVVGMVAATSAYNFLTSK